MKSQIGDAVDARTALIRAKSGDGEAFDVLAAENRHVLMSLALRILRNPDDARDAVQECLVKAFRSIADFDDSRPVRPWLCRICYNCCIDLMRERRKSGESIENFEQVLCDSSEGADEIVRRQDDDSQVRDAVRRLPERYRQIILMRHFRYMDVNDIARVLDRPEGTIKSWLFRARAILAKELRQRFGPGAPAAG